MISAKQLREWLDTLEPSALVAIDDGGLTIVQVTPETDPHDKTPAGPFLEIGGIPLPDDAAEAFSLPPSSAAQRYGPRAEELELALRSAGYRVSFDYPGEGFYLSRLSDPDETPMEQADTLEEQALVDELAEISTQ